MTDNDSTCSSVEINFSKIVPSPRKKETLENSLTQKSPLQMPLTTVSAEEINTRLLDNEDSNQGSCVHKVKAKRRS